MNEIDKIIEDAPPLETLVNEAPDVTATPDLDTLISDAPTLDVVVDNAPDLSNEREEDKSWWMEPLADVPALFDLKKPTDVTMTDLQQHLGNVVPAEENALRAVYGGMYGAMEELGMLTTPTNIAVAGATAGIGGAVGQLVKRGKNWAKLIWGTGELAMAGLMGSQVPEIFQGVMEAHKNAQNDPTQWGEFGRQLGKLVLGGGFTYAAAKGGIKNIRGGIAGVRYNRMWDDAIKENAQFDAERSILETGKRIEVPKTPDVVNEVDMYNTMVDDVNTITQTTVENLKQKPLKASEPVYEELPAVQEIKNKYKEALDIEAENYPELKSDVSKLSDIELVNRANSNSKFKDLYKFEITRRKQLNKEVKAEVSNQKKLWKEQAKLQQEQAKLQQEAALKQAEADYAANIHELQKAYGDMLDPAFKGNTVPYDGKYDIVLDTKTNKLKKVEVHLPEEAKPFLKSIQENMKNKYGYSEGKTAELLREVTDNNTRRVTTDDLKLMNKRLSMADRGATQEELVQLLRTGVKPLPSVEGTIGKSEILNGLKKSVAASGYGILDKFGEVGRTIKDRMLLKEQYEQVIQGNWMKHTREVIDKNFGNDTPRLKQFMHNVESYYATGEWPMNNKGQPLPGLEIYDEIAGSSFNEIVKLGTQVNIQVKDPITGKTIPLAEAAKDGYWPHRFPYEIVKNIHRSRPQLFESIKRTTGKPDIEVNRIIDDIYDNIKGGFKVGNLEYARVENLPGWLGDPNNPNFSKAHLLEGLRNYYQASARRLTDLYYLEGYAPDKWRLSDYINKIEDPETKLYLKKVLDSVRGVDRFDRVTRNEELAGKVRNINVMRKMTLSAIQNWFQTQLGTLPRYARLGFARTIKDQTMATAATLKDLTFKDSEQISIDIGESLETMLGVGRHGWSAKGADLLLKGNMMKVSETYNRIFSQKMGENYVQHVLDALHNRPNAPKWFTEKMQDPKLRAQFIKELKDLGISEQSIKDGNLKVRDAFGRYGITEDKIAAYRFGRSTQFRHTPADVPLLWSSPWGKVITQFMPFTFSQAKMYRDYIIKPFLKNPTMTNAKPILQHLAGSIVTGEINHQVRRYIESKVLGIKLKEDEPTWRRFLDYWVVTSMASVVYNYYMNAKYGHSVFTGSSLGDVDAVLQGVSKGRVPVEQLAPTPLNKLIRQKITGGY